MGKSLIDILLKKRLALSGKLRREQKDLDSFIEKVNGVNARYQILREKLEAEWRDQVASLEEDKTTSLRNYKDLERRVDELDTKLQRYRIEDKNLKLDRWALDPRLYYKK
jgi:predicted nuclease with TOPRIM domain